jgi:RecB family exonuclease
MLRLGAAAALERAQSSGFDPSQMADLEQALTEALHTFAALGAAQRTGELPKFEMSPRARVAAQEYLALRAAREKPAPAGIFPIVAPKGPLELSYTAIDSYLTCPRCYYLRNCMGVPQRESEFATTGITVHKALELFFNEWRLADAEGEALPGLVRLQELARATYEAGLAPSAAPDDALLDQLRHQMIVAFENLHSPNDHILELEQKILFDYPLGGMKHRFVAKIDRIDESPDGGKRVIDYKTGNATEKLKQPKKDDLQFGIYLLAMQNRFGADIRGRGEYWLLSTGEKGMLPFETMDLGKVREKIDEAITGILGGKFEPGKDCRNGDCKLIV